MIATEEIETDSATAPPQFGHWAMTPEQYFADTSCVSNSMLKTFSASVPRYHGRYVSKTLKDDVSDALRLGSAFHAMLLEPQKNLVAQAPKCDRRTKIGQSTWELFLQDNPSRIIVNVDEYTMLWGMVEGINRNPTTRKLIAEPGGKETVFRWQHEETGLWCKAMMDLVGYDVIIDLKTIDHLSKWSQNVANFGYYRQEAWYRSGDEAIIRHFGGKDYPKDFIFVVVEKEPPYESAAFTLEADAVRQGRAENEEAIAELAERMRSNNWRSRYYNQITETTLPKWKKGA